MAHRFAYLLFSGHLDDDKDVCHVCDNPKCINPNHLFIGTAKENIRDCILKGRFASEKRLKSWADRWEKEGEKERHSQTMKDAFSRLRKEGREFKRERCRNGHLFSDDNVFIDSHGDRLCRICMRTARKKREEKKGIFRELPVKDRTHCPKGHEYNEENTRINSSGARVCLACHRESVRKAHLKRKVINQGKGQKCECGCGGITNRGNKYINGHNRRNKRDAD